MLTEREQHLPPKLKGYESWLYQMACKGSIGDAFVSLPLPGHADPPGEPPNRWLIALGDLPGKGMVVSQQKNVVETEVIRLAETITDPASILEAINNYPTDLADWDTFACLLVAVIDSDRHELTHASAACVPPLIRRVDGQVESLGEDVNGLPLWCNPGQKYHNATVPIAPGEVVVFHSDGVTSLTHRARRGERWCNIDSEGLRLAISQAPDRAESVGESIVEAIDRFGIGQPQTDDITLLCLRRE